MGNLDKIGSFFQRNFKTSFSVILIGLYILVGFLEANGWKFNKDFVNTLLNFAWIGIFVNFGERAISVVGSKLQGLKLIGESPIQSNNFSNSPQNQSITQPNSNCPNCINLTK